MSLIGDADNVLESHMPTGGSALKDVRLQVIDFVVIVGYFVAIIGVGIWVSKFITRL